MKKNMNFYIEENVLVYNAIIFYISTTGLTKYSFKYILYFKTIIIINFLMVRKGVCEDKTS